MKSIAERLRELEAASRALEPGPTRRRELRQAAIAASERFLGKLDKLKAFQDTPDRGLALLDAPIQDEGLPIEQVIELLETAVFRPGANPASPGHMAYIPGGGLYPSAIGDFLAAVTNKYAGLFFTGPGPVRMENMLVRWVADLVGFPAEAAGHLASGGSIASLAAIVTARDAAGLKAADFASAVVYLTDQAHHCLDKALRIAGLAEAVIRHVAIDECWRMRADDLAAQIAEDRRAGLRPWLVIAAAGTTDTGAIDPLGEIAEVARREGCWYHVDAAYGGFFLLTDEGKDKLRGIERADSVVLDPHKSLFLPYGTGMVLVRDRRTLAATYTVTGAYLQDALRDPGEISPADVSPELTKHFRALRMWLPLVLCGVAPFRAALEEKLLLARYFHEKIARLGFEVGPLPDLTVVTFRWAPAGMALEEANGINKALVEGMRRDGRIFLSSTQLEGRFTLRLVALLFRGHRRHIDLAIRLLRDQLRALGVRA